MSSYHDRRLDRVAAVVGSTDPLAQLPDPTELRAEIDKIQADPNYVCRWSDESLQAWITQLEADVAQFEADHAP